MQLPRMIEIEQKLYARRVTDIEKAVRRAWDLAGLARRIPSGGRIAITAGSRGIDNIPAITRAIADLVKAAGGRPFVLPAMGSHGGATPAGQTELLASLGITPESVGAPIRASMATAKIGVTRKGLPVHASREALKADGLIVVNRIKQHTDFTGDYESGLVKMLAIGVGKRDGAAAMHTGQCQSLREDVPAAAAMMIKRLPVLGGIAILENGYHQTAEIVGLPAKEILTKEKGLLRRVRRNAPGFPFPFIGLLIVDWIGKDVSGVGFDTHVIARRMVWDEPEFDGSCIRVIAALDVTPGSHGNALGLGLADLVTQRLADKVDWHVVRTNVLHTGFLNRAKLPLTLPNDRELLRAAFLAMGSPDPKEARIVRVADTLNVGRLWISEGLLPEARRNPRVTILGKPTALTFDRHGDLERLAR
ncbi:MAG: DUF362 domain-containing protein [Armatimonadota bacterium]